MNTSGTLPVDRSGNPVDLCRGVANCFFVHHSERRGRTAGRSERRKHQPDRETPPPSALQEPARHITNPATQW
ncbi:MAG UNVERIFIED_CONTAM: hypothetical protein LVR18_17010 [Planctomycetaceae bacterium]